MKGCVEVSLHSILQHASTSDAKGNTEFKYAAKMID